MAMGVGQIKSCAHFLLKKFGSLGNNYYLCIVNLKGIKIWERLLMPH